MNLNKLIPELANKTVAFTDGNMVLIKLQQSILLVLTKEEYETAVNRFKDRANLHQPLTYIITLGGSKALVLVKDEYKKALRRGKSVLRSRELDMRVNKLFDK